MTSDFDRALEALSDEERIANVEDARDSTRGISVKFRPEVDSYDEAVGIVEPILDSVIEVDQYSNMSGQGDPEVILLVELSAKSVES